MPSRLGTLVIAAVGFLAFVWGPAPAEAKRVTVYFDGPHPIDPKVHKGMCYIGGPHFHSYKPRKTNLVYVKSGRSWVYVGDPTAHEKHAPKHAYYGHHPLFWVRGGPKHAYCYITGPHHHWQPPSVEVGFKLHGGAYWYVRPHPRWYKSQRWRARQLDRHYAGVVIERPTVEISSPPPGFVGIVIRPGGARVDVAVPGVHIRGPGVHIKGPGVHIKGPHWKVRGPSASVKVKLPSVNIKIGGPGIRIRGGKRYKYKRHKYKRHKYKRHKYKRHKYKRRGKGRWR